MGPDELAHRIREHELAAVVCLRGPSPQRRWWQEELAVCEEFGVPLYALGWSAFGVGEDRIVAYLRLLDTLPRPFLLHCLSGRDRTGLAAAIFRHHVLGHLPEDADDELRFVPYGHVPLFGYEAMDEAFEHYVQNYARLREEALRPGPLPERFGTTAESGPTSR